MSTPRAWTLHRQNRLGDWQRRWTQPPAPLFALSLACSLLLLLRVTTPLPADQDRWRGQIELADGGRASGLLMPGADSGTLRWLVDGFDQPLELPPGAVQRIKMEVEPDSDPGEDEFCCLLADGTRLMGRLMAIDQQQIELLVSHDQRLRIQRRQVSQLIRATAQLKAGRWVGSDSPSRIAPWPFTPDGQPIDDDEPAQPGPAADGQQQDRGRLAAASTATGAWIDLALERHAVIDLELSWDQSGDGPSFDLALGIHQDHQSLQQAIRLSAWKGQWLLQRDTDDDAAIQPLAIEPPQVEDRVRHTVHERVVIQLDQQAGLAIVATPEGAPMGKLQLPCPDAEMGSGVRLKVSQGTRVRHITALSLPQVIDAPLTEAEHAAVSLLDDRQREGTILSLHPDDRLLQVSSDDGDQAIELDQVQRLKFTHSPAVSWSKPPQPLDEDDTQHTDGPRRYRVLLADGSDFHAHLRGIDGPRLNFWIPNIDQALTVEMRTIDTMRLARRGQNIARPKGSGVLISQHAWLPGRIAPSGDGDGDGDGSAFRWQPLAGNSAARLSLPADAVIHFREGQSWTWGNRTAAAGRTGQTAADDQRAAPAVRMRAVRPGGNQRPEPQIEIIARAGNRQVRRRVDADGRVRTVIVNRPGAELATPKILLRNGDTIAAEVASIDQAGVHFSSESLHDTRARHDQVQSVILADLVTPAAISKSTRDRLLMIPRAQRDDPPTHLVCSRDGDFLRGRLIQLDEETLTIEVRLQTREVPRQHVAQIFWLHPEDPAQHLAAGSDVDLQGDDAKAAAGDDRQTPPSSGPLLQAVRGDGSRLTFRFTRFSATDMLYGDNDIVGPVEVGLEWVDHLLLDRAIGSDRIAWPLADWRPHDAPTPKAFQPDAGRGSEAALVGQPAPEFQLVMLSGDRFRLADARGRIVVLDFWASWCGPCIQAMPQVDEVVNRFDTDRVQLVAVNLQESAEAIRPTLQRMGIDPPVALDRTGKVAELYDVTAIPQTVVIDAEGNVARLFVGAGRSLANDLAEALEQLLH